MGQTLPMPERSVQLLIAIITHPQDRRFRTFLDGYLQLAKPFYQISSILMAGRSTGLRWFYTDPGQKFRAADAAWLHVDLSLIPQDYLDLAARYPVAINGQVADIRKRQVSHNLVDQGSDWQGPVLVKSDLNCQGSPETFIARKMARLGGLPFVSANHPEYRLFDGLGLVPDAVWQDRTRVVEKYLPETRGGTNVLRVWSFLGSHERCNWYSSPEIIVKGQNIVEFGPCPVPDEIRAERRRLGFDYGKFDFAIGPEGPVLYDANRTPGRLNARADYMRAEADRMSSALIRLVKG